MKRALMLLVLAAVLGLSGTANATLWDRGGGLIYDSDLSITWLQDANYAKTSGYDDDGRMDLSNALAWANQLVYGGYDDWRLPKAVDGPYVYGYDGTTIGGFNITTSEMGYMYYVNLGNLAYYDVDGQGPQQGWGLQNTGPFQNLQDYYYWSGTECDDYPGTVYMFGFLHGGQSLAGGYQGGSLYAWAVRDGDVAPVPEPATMLLLSSGILWLAGFRRRFRKK